jgi:acetyl esterase
VGCEARSLHRVTPRIASDGEAAFRRSEAAAEEVADAVKYFALHAEEYGIDKENMAVGGHSAGGQISASAALMLKDAGVYLACQMLVYPALNMSDFANGMLKDLMPVFFPNGGWDHPYNSPLLASNERLAGVAPAIFILCGPDMLKPQGIAYAKRLIDLGVPVKVKEYPKAEHGFLEVNRPDYTQGDPRQTPEQAAYTRDCEQYLIRELRACFGC